MNNMSLSDIKKAILHLRRGRWVEVGFKNISGVFDITCVSHFRDFLSDYANNKLINVTKINYL